MDELFLDRYLSELSPVLRGARLEKAFQYGPTDLALRLWLRPERRTLLLSADPNLPLLALIDEEPPEPRQRYALLEAVRARAVPGVIAGVEKLPGDRVVVLHLARGASGGEPVTHRLVAELIPRRSCLLLLDPDGRIVAGAGTGLPGKRGLGTGKAYVAPGPPPVQPLAGLGSLSPLLRRELEVRSAEDGVSLEAALASLLEQVDRAPAPTLTSRESGGVVATPVPYRSLPGESRSFATYRELVATLYAESVVGQRGDVLRHRLQAAVQKRLERLAHTRSRIETNAAEAAHAEDDRSFGELLLAYQVTARRDGAAAVVPHPETPEATLVIPLLDPRATLLENARIYFDRYRTRKRTTTATRARLEQLALERQHLEDLDSAIETALPADLPLLEPEVLGETRPQAARVRPRPAGRRPVDALAPRRFRSAGGAEIRVGRSSRGNAHLTFALARDHDFWLHAEGPGAHVVLANESRSAEPPPEDLIEAAALAAWFSKLRGAGRAEVHWTTRRNVQRIPGAPPGQVLLKAHRSVRVSPALAAERFGLDGDGAAEQTR